LLKLTCSSWRPAISVMSTFRMGSSQQTEQQKVKTIENFTCRSVWANSDLQERKLTWRIGCLRCNCHHKCYGPEWQPQLEIKLITMENWFWLNDIWKTVHNLCRFTLTHCQNPPAVYSLHALHSAGIGTATMLGVLINTKLQIQNSEQELVQLKV
jgi:hypothetical protein